MASRTQSSASATAFYAEDTITLIANRVLLGTIDRTHSDVDTHGPLDPDDYPEGIDQDELSDTDFRSFLRSGVPPVNTVLVTWSFVYQDGEILGSSLIPCSKLELVDRSVLTGDVVKRKASDAQSGVVIHTTSRTTLFPPRRWSQTGLAAADARNIPDEFNVLLGVPSHELCKPCIYEEEDMIIYKGWVGRIEDVHRQVSIRLPNGSVVKVDENAQGLEFDERSGGIPNVGDPVTAKKGTLRAGRWIFGQYDANQEPSGRIADVQAIDILVHWLKRRYHKDDLPQPDALISGEDLVNGSILMYDQTAVPKDSNAPPIGLETSVGDSVRFRDLDKAAQKYNGMKPMIGFDHVNQLNKIPRTQTLGFDINVYLVGRTMARCVVMWQDCSISEHFTTDIVPSQSLDDEDDAWPGEVVFPKEAREVGQSIYNPTKAGVVQSVDAKNRIATVKWMPHASCSFSIDDNQEILLPGSRTGVAKGKNEKVSLYDIWTLRGFSRRLGDFVVLSPPQYDMESCKDGSITPKLLSVLSSDTSEGRWMGEVVDLGLDGLLTIRLGACSNVEDIRVPWECTELAYSSDQADDDTPIFPWNLDSSGEDEGESSEDADQNAVWKDEFDQDVIMDDDWESDDSNAEPVKEASISAHQGADSQSKEVTDKSGRVSGDKAGSQSQATSNQNDTKTTFFSYADMSLNTEGAAAIEPFEILEGEVPSDHHWATNEEPPASLARISKEHKILTSSLPPGVYVRTWESSLHLMRVLMLGPIGSPYEYAPFVFDIRLGDSFPHQPPQLFFHSWTSGTGSINPNLYENGSVCLSLLGTWKGHAKAESWNAKSTILQVIVSLLGLVLVKEPYYNEAGFEARSGTADTAIPSAVYSEKAYMKTRAFISRAIKEPPGGLTNVIHKLYLSNLAGDPHLLLRATASTIIVVLSNKSDKILKTWKQQGSSIDWLFGSGRTITAGAVIPLKRIVTTLLEALDGVDSPATKKLHGILESNPSNSVVKELFNMSQ